jgi:hypothetical protein
MIYSLQHSADCRSVYRDTILGEKEVDNFVLVAGGILLNKVKYS